MSILELLGFKHKVHVGISVSVNNIIELTVINEKTKAITIYASNNIKYNSALREIMDINEFSSALEELFENAELDPGNCAVTLNIPNVHFGITYLENVADRLAAEDNLFDELQDLYIFKRKDSNPVIKSVLVDTESKTAKNIAYSAVQQKNILSLIDVFDSLGTELVRIQTSYSALYNSLIYCERFNKYIRTDNTATVLLITPNNCAALNFKNQKINTITEEPIAVKSFTKEEVYSTVAKIANNAIAKNNPGSFLIISETDEVDADQLLQSINFDGESDSFNKSNASSEEFIEIDPLSDRSIDPNLVSFITLEAVGAAVSDYDEFDLDINFMPEERIPKNIIKINDLEGSLVTFLTAWLIITALVIGCLFGITKVILDNQINKFNQDTSNSNSNINMFKKNSEQSKNNKSSIFPTLQTISENNKNIIDIYNALSTDIPQDIYIKRFVVNPQGGIGIQGESRNSDAVDKFISGLKEKNSNLMVQKLAYNDPVADPSVTIPNGITFEIKTTNIDVQFLGDLLQNLYVQQEQQQQRENTNGAPGGYPSLPSENNYSSRPSLL